MFSLSCFVVTLHCFLSPIRELTFKEANQSHCPFQLLTLEKVVAYKDDIR